MLDLLVKALTEIEKKSAEIPHYRDKQYSKNKNTMAYIERALIDAIEATDEMCFDD